MSGHGGHPLERAITYIDGFNLYYGLRTGGWKRFYWISPQKLALTLLRPGQQLVSTKYFTSLVGGDPEKRARQEAFLGALRTLGNIEIHFGKFLSETICCRHCGKCHVTHHEKMTDVSIAIEMLCDAFGDRFDVAVLVSGDRDLAGAARRTKELFGKKVVAAFPPCRFSKAPSDASSGFVHVARANLAKSVMPDRVISRTGTVFERPLAWQ